MEMISSPSCVMKPSSSLKSFPAWTGVRCQPELLAGNRNFQACLQPEMTRLLAGNRTIPAGKMPTSNWKSPFSFWKCHYFQPDWCSLPAGNCFILAGLCPASQPEMFFLAGFCPNFQREITSFMLDYSPFPARNHFFLPSVAVAHITKFNFYVHHSVLKSFVADTKTLSAFLNKKNSSVWAFLSRRNNTEARLKI